MNEWFTDDELRILSRQHHYWTADHCAACSEETHLDWRRIAWTMVGIGLSLMGLLALGGLVSAVFGWRA